MRASSAGGIGEGGGACVGGGKRGRGGGRGSVPGEVARGGVLWPLPSTAAGMCAEHASHEQRALADEAGHDIGVQVGGGAAVLRGGVGGWVGGVGGRWVGRSACIPALQRGAAAGGQQRARTAPPLLPALPAWHACCCLPPCCLPPHLLPASLPPCCLPASLPAASLPAACHPPCCLPPCCLPPCCLPPSLPAACLPACCLLPSLLPRSLPAASPPALPPPPPHLVVAALLHWHQAPHADGAAAVGNPPGEGLHAAGLVLACVGVKGGWVGGRHERGA